MLAGGQGQRCGARDRGAPGTADSTYATAQHPAAEKHVSGALGKKTLPRTPRFW